MNKKGFTLIELLVVIAVIALLSTLAIVSLGDARAKARDAKRLADIKEVMTALSLYYNDEAKYPATVVSGGKIEVPSGATYMAQVPFDPLNASPNIYTYMQDTAGSSYHITYQLEKGTVGITGGANHNATPAGLQND